MELLLSVVFGVIFCIFACFGVLISVYVFKDFAKWVKTKNPNRIPSGILIDRHKIFFATALSVPMLYITVNLIASVFLFLVVYAVAGNIEFWNRLIRQPNSWTFFTDLMSKTHMDENILKHLFPECGLMETFTLKDAETPCGLLHKAAMIIESLDMFDFEPRVAVLFHDIAKPSCYRLENEDPFHNHAEIGADMAKRY